MIQCEELMRTPVQIKNLVDEWCRSLGYTIKDIATEQGNAPIEWALEINNGTYGVIVFTPKNLDMLRFQTQINFSPEHRQKTGNMPNEESNSFVLQMTDRLASYGCDWNFIHDQQNPKQMNTLSMMYFIVYDNVDKNIVLQILNKAFINQSQMVRAISITLNKGGSPQGTSVSSHNTSFYG